MRITPIHIEINSWNGLILEVLGIDYKHIDGSLFSIYYTCDVLYIEILFTEHRIVIRK